MTEYWRSARRRTRIDGQSMVWDGLAWVPEYEFLKSVPVWTNAALGKNAFREQFENRPDQPYTLAALPLQPKRPRRLDI